MKLNTILYTLVAASATLANVLPRSDACIDKINKKYEDKELVKLCFSKIKSPKIETILENPDIIRSKFEEMCTTYKSEKCQKLREDIINSVSTCDSTEGKALKEELLEYTNANEIICATDENNKLCPLNDFIVETNIKQVKLLKKYADEGNRDKMKQVKDDEEAKLMEALDNAINGSCKSKTCTDAGVNYLLLQHDGLNSAESNKYKDIIFDKPFSTKEAKNENEYYIITFLKSDYCIKQQQNTQGASSGNQPQNIQGATTGNQLQNIQNTTAGNQTQSGAVNGNQQNVQSSGASTIKYSMMLTVIALCFTLF